jgi:hypothetical protein
MNEADKQYMAVPKVEEEEHDLWEFIGHQIIGILALALVVLSLWMIVASVVMK